MELFAGMDEPVRDMLNLYGINSFILSFQNAGSRSKIFPRQ
jgi:hypothetical protein